MSSDAARSQEATAGSAPPSTGSRVRGVLTGIRRLTYLLVSLFLFAFSLIVMQLGAQGLQPFIRDMLHVSGVSNSLGFGWLSAYVILSGSPVAAVSLTLLNTNVLSPLEGYAMITGSRLGASLIVLVIGFIYAVRGHERTSSLSMGVLSFLVTAVVQVAALALGGSMIVARMTPQVRIEAVGAFTSVVDRTMGGSAQLVAERADAIGGPALTFLTGLGLILASFALFDRGLPPLGLKGTALGDVARVLYRPSVMFALGLAVTFVSMSVSVSLSLLVPLSARGYVKRENVVPYIMGANITTYMDTLLGALIISSAVAASVVLTQMVAVLIVSTLILAFALRPFENAVLKIMVWTTASPRNLGVFVLSLFAVPLVLLAL